MRIGIDLLYLQRIEPIAQHRRFRQLVFTPAELAEAPTDAPYRELEFLAGRLAAKEAVAKLLGCGFLRGVGWRDIQIVGTPHGGPRIRLHARARLLAARHRIGAIAVSITHQQGCAVAVAVAGTATAQPRRRRPDGASQRRGRR